MAVIMVTGAGGQLGKALQRVEANHLRHSFLFLDKSKLDITNELSVHKFVNDNNIQFIINCAAYTAVDKAESEKELAYAINETAVAFLAKAAASTGAKLIHISTDYVFDGNANEPYTETSQTNPLSVYGASKLGGEKACHEFASANSVILRTSWVYDASSHNFVNTMLRIMKSGKNVAVVSDQWGTPTYAPDLAAAIMHIIDHAHWQPGVFHFTNEGSINWYHFAAAIQQKAGLTAAVSPIPTTSYPTPAQRPAYSVLSKEKIQQCYSLQLVPWELSLDLCLQQSQR